MSKNKTLEQMGFQEFLIRMKEQVGQVIGESYYVDINHVIKNNSIELDALIILKKEESVSPNIYLNMYYEKYLDGESIEDITNEIITVYYDTVNEDSGESVDFRYELDDMKPLIIYRLINYDKNKKLLQAVPHIKFLDLAITFHCLVKNNTDGIGTIRITNNHMNTWNIDLNDLKVYARRNTPKLFPAVVKNMNEVMIEILENEKQSVTTNKKAVFPIDFDKEQSVNDMIQDLDIKDDSDMYVLTNLKGINGASCLLYPHVLKEFADAFGTDIYILPSSIHEIILIKDNGLLDRQLLKEMVHDVNCTQVPEEEILSESVYYYSREKDAITMY